MKKKYVFISLLIIVVLCLVFVFFVSNREKPIPETLTVVIKEKTYTMQVARTALARERGLSKTNRIPHDGMIFLFPKPGIYSFWMKDMNYPIDIIWIDKNFQIIEIKENIYPGTYPQVFTPQKESLYVLETQAGFVEEHNIKINDTIKLIQ